MCKRTLAGKSDVPLIDKVKKMVTGFAKYGVTREMIEKRLGHTIEAVSPDEFVEYVGIFNSLKDGMSKVAEWFDAPKEANETTAAIDAAMNAEDSKK